MAKETSLFDKPKEAGFSWQKFFQKNKLLVILLMLGGLLFSLGILFLVIFSSQEQAKVEIISSPENSPSSEKIFVHLAGAVQKPGLYELAGNARLNDALIAAGGLSAKADRNWFEVNINLAQKLSDGIKIYIPFIDELETKKGEVAGFSVVNQDGKINLNSAGLTELDSLPGIGPATAQKIIDYRQTNGLFSKIEDLMNVSGIGEKTFEELKNKITI